MVGHTIQYTIYTNNNILPNTERPCVHEMIEFFLFHFFSHICLCSFSLYYDPVFVSHFLLAFFSIQCVLMGLRFLFSVIIFNKCSLFLSNFVTIKYHIIWFMSLPLSLMQILRLYPFSNRHSILQ